MRRGAVDVGCVACGGMKERKNNSFFLTKGVEGEEMGCEHDAARSQYLPNSRYSGKKATQKASFRNIKGRCHSHSIHSVSV